MYFLYILQCTDNTLYTGITVDLERRVFEHNNSTLGAKYTSARRPVKLVFSKKFRNRSLVSKEEFRVKQLSREEKLEMIRVYAKMDSLFRNQNKMAKGNNKQQKEKKKPKKDKKK